MLWEKYRIKLKHTFKYAELLRPKSGLKNILVCTTMLQKDYELYIYFSVTHDGNGLQM